MLDFEAELRGHAVTAPNHARLYASPPSSLPSPFLDLGFRAACLTVKNLWSNSEK